MRTAAALLLLLGACTGTEVATDWHVAADRTDDVAPLDPADFAGHTAVLAGFDPPEQRPRPRVGDRVLFGVEATDEDATQRCLLLAEVVEAPAVRDGQALFWNGRFTLTTRDGRRHTVEHVSRTVRVRLTRLDLAGREQQRSEAIVAADTLVYGIDRACALYLGRDPEAPSIDDAEARVLAMSLLSANNLLEVVQQDEVLASILWRAARAPSTWSVLSGLGVALSLYPHLDKALRKTGFPGPDDPLWRLPIEVRANDQPALLVLIDAVTPRAPWHFGGLVGLTARRPGEVDARLIVRLLAARRGPD